MGAQPYRRHDARRRAPKSTRPLTREQRAEKAVNIIGKDKGRRADIEATVDQISKMNERSERIRREGSVKQKQFAEQYGLALRKVISLMRRAPTDFHVPSALGIAVNVPELGIDKEAFIDHEYLLRHLELLSWLCEKAAKSKLTPKPDAYEQRHAARAALHLLKTHGIKPTMTRKSGENTKASVFCRLAAVLYGDESADLQYHCRNAVKRLKKQQRQEEEILEKMRRSAKPGQA
jgi:hypothetical protein